MSLKIKRLKFKGMVWSFLTSLYTEMGALTRKNLRWGVLFARIPLDEPHTMKLADTDLNKRDREWVERVLQPGEELLVVCKPQARLWRSEYTSGAPFAVVWIGGVALFTWGMGRHVLEEVAENPKILLLVLFMLPFWLMSLCFMMAPWRNRTVARRTLYLLTNRRAVVLKPTFLLMPNQVDYPMGPDMIRDIVVRADGSGDVVLGYETHCTRHGTHYEPMGFMRVPHVEQVAALLRKHMPAAPPLPEPGVAGAGSRPFELSGDDDRPVEFPNVLQVIVGCVFIFFGAAGVVQGVQYIQSGAGGDWLMVILNVGFPGLFAAVGCRAVWSWVSDFRAYLRKKR